MDPVVTTLMTVLTQRNAQVVQPLLDVVRVRGRSCSTHTTWQGLDGGKMIAKCDIALVVPADDTARIQEAHIFLAHTLCADIEIALGLVTAPKA